MTIIRFDQYSQTFINGNQIQEFWNNGNRVWIKPEVTPSILAAGGTEDVIDVNGQSYKIHTFSAGGVFEVYGFIPNAEYLIVAGGGGGGISEFDSGAGGSCGEPLFGTMALSPQSYPITIGTGGAGGYHSPGLPYTLMTGLDGGASSALGLSAVGGLGGAGNRGVNGKSGKYGSGGANAGGQGGVGTVYSGARGAVGGDRGSGGGAGAGGPGQLPTNDSNITERRGGLGGPGISRNITGVEIVYSKGGAGSSHIDPAMGANGSTPGSAGNGGNRTYQNSGNRGGNGANGIVIIRYPVVI